MELYGDLVVLAGLEDVAHRQRRGFVIFIPLDGVGDDLRHLGPPGLQVYGIFHQSHIDAGSYRNSVKLADARTGHRVILAVTAMACKGNRRTRCGTGTCGIISERMGGFVLFLSADRALIPVVRVIPSHGHTIGVLMLSGRGLHGNGHGLAVSGDGGVIQLAAAGHIDCSGVTECIVAGGGQRDGLVVAHTGLALVRGGKVLVIPCVPQAGEIGGEIAAGDCHIGTGGHVVDETIVDGNVDCLYRMIYRSGGASKDIADIRVFAVILHFPHKGVVIAVDRQGFIRCGLCGERKAFIGYQADSHHIELACLKGLHGVHGVAVHPLNGVFTHVFAADILVDAAMLQHGIATHSVAWSFTGNRRDNAFDGNLCDRYRSNDPAVFAF